MAIFDEMFYEVPRIVINNHANTFVSQRYKMAKTRGEILEKAIRSSKMAITTVANKKEVSQRHMYNLFKSDNISNDDMVAFGKIINYDFSKDIPELKEFMELQDPQAAYRANIDWQKKYFDLLEKTNKLLEEKLAQSEKENKKKK